MDISEKLVKPFPHDKVNFLNRAFIIWIFPLFRLGYKKKDLDLTDIYGASDEDQSDQLRDKLQREWSKELKKRKPSLPLAIYRAFLRRYVLATIVIGGYEQLIVKMAQPFFLGALLDYFAGLSHVDGHEIYWLALGFSLCSILFLVFHHSWLLYMVRTGMKIRVAVQSLLMEKTFKLSKSAIYNNKVGNITNLMSNDVAKFDEAAWYGRTVIIAPLEAIVISVILFNILGYPYIIGLVLLIAFVPFQAAIGRTFGRIRRSTAEWSDKRIRVMSEIVTGMKVIKFYAWETPFSDLIAQIRESEVYQIRKACVLRAINFTLMFVTTRIILFAVFIIYVMTGHQLTAKAVFVSSAFFNTLRHSLTNLFPQGVSALSESLISCRRLEEYLLLEEKKSLELNSNEKTSSPLITEKRDSKYLNVNNLVACWDPSDEEPVLNGISMQVKSGDLVLVVGPVGTGKSSLLLALMKEIVIKNGTIDINRKISYASQESWTWNASIKDNIIFGQKFDENRYKKVLEVTTLERDVDILPYGDKTLVGERGVGLSGGQRARVNLARAIYRDADIYLLDDPLSAVDAKVASTIFQKCFKEFLKENIVVLVSHQIQFLSKADKILLLHDSGSKFYDSVADMEDSASVQVGLAITRDRSVTKTIGKGSEKARTKRSDSIVSRSSIGSELSLIDEEIVVTKQPMIAEETKVSGDVAGRVYWAYIKAGASIPVLFIFIVLNFASQILFNATDLWLSVWTNEAQQQGETQFELTINTTTIENISTTNSTFSLAVDTQQSKITFNSIVYSILIVSMLITTLIRSFLFFFMCNQSSINLHNSIFYRVLRSPMSLFESQPIGRILNRFSRDLGIIDELLPINAYNLLLTSFQIVGMLALVAYVSWYLIFPATVLCILVLIWRAFYIPSQQSIKRLEAITRSPVYSHISTTTEGLATIRAFDSDDLFRNQFRIILNNHSATWVLYLTATRCLGLWIDWMCAIYVTIVAFVLTAASDFIPAGDAGLALSNAVGIVSIMQALTRQSTEFESQMTSVERIIEYTQLSTEANLESKDKPPVDWPREGSIEFKGLTLQYPSAPKPTLEKITILIESGEKVGVVGRTGAGKSSLLSCLFRIVEFTGTLEIDGINIQKIGLHDLRRKISIIPQEPVLFAGTIRTNLDPFKEHADHKLWEALDDVQLKETVLELNDHLDHEIREGGSNFSVGQRQLICLGRALLRKNKILVIDEATANVDHETDSLIQQTIRTKFSHCTVLTIAHRLHTIIDSNRVLVLDAGQVEEFDVPYNLLKIKSSIFYQLVAQTGKSMSSKLHKMAAESALGTADVINSDDED